MTVFYIDSFAIEEAKVPTAVPLAEPAYGVIGSIVILDGRSSNDPMDQPLSFKWRFISVPVGSSVEQESFKLRESDSSIVSFSPDIVGEYVVGLVASNGAYDSEEVQTRVSVRASIVPYARGMVPDGKFIWSYIRDVWTQVQDKEWFATFWSALIQIVGSDLLRAYQVDFNKSISTIQDLYQRRWLNYDPKLLIDSSNCSFILGCHQAGVDGSTNVSGIDSKVILISVNGQIEAWVSDGTVFSSPSGKTLTIFYDNLTPANVGAVLDIKSLNRDKSGYVLKTSLAPSPLAAALTAQFTIASKSWTFTTLPSSVRVGDVAVIGTGINKGYYKILNISGLDVTVDYAPTGQSLPPGLSSIDIYRPVGVTINASTGPLTDTLSIPNESVSDTPIPGRIVVSESKNFTLLRSTIDSLHDPKLLKLTSNSSEIVTGFDSVSWRFPHTLISKTQDFESLGVATGDTIIVDVVRSDSGVFCPLSLQVVGVSKNRVGVVLTTDPVKTGVVPDIQDIILTLLSDDLGIGSYSFSKNDGSLILQGDAKILYEYFNSIKFKRTDLNKELTTDHEFKYEKYSFKIVPRYIIRNKSIPVDDTLLSIPILQDWIKQPIVAERDGRVFQSHNGVDYEIFRKPYSLVENADFIVDSEVAYDGSAYISTGTDSVFIENGYFKDRNLRSGDTFRIIRPSTLAGDYIIKQVISNTDLLLDKSIPEYVLGDVAFSHIQLLRTSPGKFIRFLPGTFTANNPAPERLWADVSFFDNGESIENNFGLLVGLTQNDLEKINSNASYRQSVAGLMFAMTKGSAIEKIRLGAQILLGLPFAEHRGIIRSIDNDYRVALNGDPSEGRMAVEDLDTLGKPSGIFRYYIFPVDPSSDLAGVEVNPSTGVAYVVGDVVELFAPLCKGAKILDYINSPSDSPSFGPQALTKFHKIKALINDSVFTTDEINLVSRFLKKITPSYIASSVAILTEIDDDIDLDDFVNSRVIASTLDQASFSIPTPMALDPDSFEKPGTVRVGDGVFWNRKTSRSKVYHGGMPTYATANFVGKDFSISSVGSYLKILDGSNAGMYEIDTYVSPTEVTLKDAITAVPVTFLDKDSVVQYELNGWLKTSYNVVPSFIGTFPSGGLVTPQFEEGPVSVLGDKLLILDGPNKGLYDISAVTDTSVTVSSVTTSSPDTGFQTYFQRFAILRPVKPLILSGSTASYSSANAVIEINSGGLRAYGVSNGDTLLVQNVASTGYDKYKIVRVGGIEDDGESPTLSPGEVQVTPVPTSTASSKPFKVYRTELLGNPYSDQTYTISGGSNIITISDDAKWLLDSGDELLVEAIGQRFTVLDPLNGYVSPAPPAGPHTAKICKKRGMLAGTSGFGLSIWDLDPLDLTESAIIEDDLLGASCSSGSNIVTLQMQRTESSPHAARAAEPFNPYLSGIRPGDVLVLTSGTNSTHDVGYGPGIFPIVQVTSTAPNGDVRLSVNLPNTGSAAWKIVRRM